MTSQSRRLGHCVAGAAAGALGCLTAATLLAPVAIAALPAWTVLGAAVGAVIRASVPDRSDDGGRPDEAGPDDAVRSAALFALLLELQGRGEAAITRILDQVVGDQDDIALGDEPAARRWLDGLRHRLDLALAAEGGAS